jgi:hypothetical protein
MRCSLGAISKSGGTLSSVLMICILCIGLMARHARICRGSKQKGAVLPQRPSTSRRNATIGPGRTDLASNDQSCLPVARQLLSPA